MASSPAANSDDTIETLRAQAVELWETHRSKKTAPAARKRKRPVRGTVIIANNGVSHGLHTEDIRKECPRGVELGKFFQDMTVLLLSLCAATERNFCIDPKAVKRNFKKVLDGETVVCHGYSITFARGEISNMPGCILKVSELCSQLLSKITDALKYQLNFMTRFEEKKRVHQGLMCVPLRSMAVISVNFEQAQKVVDRMRLLNPKMFMGRHHRRCIKYIYDIDLNAERAKVAVGCAGWETGGGC